MNRSKVKEVKCESTGKVVGWTVPCYRCGAVVEFSKGMSRAGRKPSTPTKPSNLATCFLCWKGVEVSVK